MAFSDGKSVQLERGCPQGSVLAPTLWNILYDVIIDQIYNETTRNICVYADDTILIVSANAENELQIKIETCMETMHSELIKIGLLLNVGKTEILLQNRLPLYMRGQNEMLNINIDNQTVATKKTIKYLGMMLDSKLTYKQHLKYIEEKMLNRIPILQNVARNLYGYSYRARKTMFQGLIYSALPSIAHLFGTINYN